MCACSKSCPGWWRRLVADRRGVTAMEFGMFGLAFFYLLFATFDLGRYFLTLTSMRALVGQMAHLTLIYCDGQGPVGACTLPATGSASVATAEADVPFLVPGNFSTAPVGTRSEPNGAGIATITATATYPFTFIFLPWTGLNASMPLSVSTSMAL